MNASHNNALLKPDAGKLHVRFDEGEGSRRSLALEPLIPWLPSLLYLDFYQIFDVTTAILGIQSRIHFESHEI